MLFVFGHLLDELTAEATLLSLVDVCQGPRFFFACFCISTSFFLSLFLL